MPGQNKPQPQTLEKNAHSIHTLHVAMNLPHRVKHYTTQAESKESSALHNLQELVVIFGKDETRIQERQTREALVLIRSNPNLKRLTLLGDKRKHKQVMIEDQTWQSIMDHSLNWKELVLDGLYLSKGMLVQLFKIGHQLVKLKIKHCRFEDRNNSLALFTDSTTNESSQDNHDNNNNAVTTTTPVFPNLTELAIDHHYNDFDIYEWTQNSPQLNSFEWKRIMEDSDLDLYKFEARFFKILDNPVFWSRIQSVTFTTPCFRLLSDSRITSILNRCAPLTKFSMPGSSFWYRSLDALERHFPTLEYINLRMVRGVLSWVIQYLLTSCPSLLTFKATPMHGNQIVPSALSSRLQQGKLDEDYIADREFQDQVTHETPLDRYVRWKVKTLQEHMVQYVHPWVCLKLEHLDVCLSYVRDPSWSVAIFEQLSKLTRLRILHVNVDKDCPDKAGPRFQLDLGMRQLKAIPNLESLEFNNSLQNMQSQDVIWILKQWPNLRNLSRNFHTDKRINSQLCKLVKIPIQPTKAK
ncbi:hypothetical protein BGZ83_010694 [Gryganskiella cystojenkinii]|nr:hypothetical protein BGZ83_010694 [Gryganskiella cystojenkinii]